MRIRACETSQARCRQRMETDGFTKTRRIHSMPFHLIPLCDFYSHDSDVGVIIVLIHGLFMSLRDAILWKIICAA